VRAIRFGRDRKCAVTDRTQLDRNLSIRRNTLNLTALATPSH
jgi:hypothetical protein